MYRVFIGLISAGAFAASVGAPGLGAQEHDHEHEPLGHSHAGLHFTHPLIAESVTPDTKVRLDHQFLDLPDGDEVHLGNIEAEYALFRGFSIEAGLPFSYTDGVAGNLEVALKFGNFALEDSGILLGYGIEFGFPTAGEIHEEEPLVGIRPTGVDGSLSAQLRSSAQSSSGGTIGEAEWEIAPFLNIGVKTGNLEVVAWSIFGIPFNQEEGEEPTTEIGYNLSALYHFSPRFKAILELDGSGGISGEAVGQDVLNLSPGVIYQLIAGSPLHIGSSVGLPLTNEEAFSIRWTTSVFWHF